MAAFKWGIIGPGKIATKFAKDLALVDKAKLHAIASRNPDRARSFADEFGVVEIFHNYESLVKSGAIDIAYIATPHSFHHDQTLLCLQHNIPVLCEKPAGINAKEVASMIKASKSNQTFFMEALWTRFLPSLRHVLEIIKSGEMGEVENVEAEFCFKAPYDENSRLYDMNLAGGSILDIGIYPVFLAYLLLGVPSKIEASGQLAPTGADQTASIRFTYADHKSAALHSSILYQSDMPARITMSKGYILMQPRWHESPALTLLKAGEDPQQIQLPPIGKGFTHEIEACHDSLRLGQIENSLWSHQDSLHLIRILDEIRHQVGVVYPSEK